MLAAWSCGKLPNLVGSFLGNSPAPQSAGVAVESEFFGDATIRPTLIIEQHDPAPLGDLLGRAVSARPLLKEFPLAGVHSHRFFGKAHVPIKRRIREHCLVIYATVH